MKESRARGLLFILIQGLYRLVRSSSTVFITHVVYVMARARRKLTGERISDFNFTYNMPQLILFLVTSIFRLALK